MRVVPVMTAYWTEAVLDASGVDGDPADVAFRLAELLDSRHDGDVTYTVSGARITFALTCTSPEAIEFVSQRVVGMVRAAARELGSASSGDSGPANITDIRVTRMLNLPA